MFTGLVQAIGTVRTVLPTGGGRRLVVEAPSLAPEVAVGDSVAVGGVCLTAVAIDATTLTFDVVAESIGRTTLGDRRPGDGVNLELALRASDRLGGHFVQGHVDGVGTVRTSGPRAGDHVLEIAADRSLTRYMVEKGSIAIDGVSLTLTRVTPELLAVALIPHTRQVTTLGALRPGSRVHLEVDLLAKYVEKLLQGEAVR